MNNRNPKLTYLLYNTGTSCTVLGVIASLFLGFFVNKLDQDPWTYKIWYGLDVDTFRGYLALAVIAAMVGIILTVVSVIRAKSEQQLVATENLAQRNYCHHCEVNVTYGTHICPICSKEIKEK